jgi:peptidyl-prolyl cis-trans isomerase D
MPLMTKIRESLSTFFSVFAGLFVIYIVLDWGMDITGRKHSTRDAEAQTVGKINNQPVLYKEFSEQVRIATENQKNQTHTDPDEDQIRALRDQIWNQLVDQRLYDEQSEKLNITVTDQEIIDWVRGDNPPEFLRQQFVDSTGTFNRQMYEATILDPRNKKKMLDVEDYLKKQRMREKLQSIVLASVHVSESEILQRFTDQNVKYEFDALLFDPNQLVADSTVKISDDDLRREYNDHSDEFKVEASRNLKYVLFREAASQSDTDDVVKEMSDIAKRASAGVDFAELAKTYSETPAADTYFKHGELSQAKETAIFAGKTGDIIGPLTESDGYHVMKIEDFRAGKDDFIHASHILIRVENNDSITALKRAKDILAKAKNGQDFAELAKTNSSDGSASNGGDLGWFGKGRMVKPFEEAAYKAKVGQIVGPIRTQFGYHLIKVLGRDNREVKIADIRMAVHPSSQTKNDISQRAQDFAFLAKDGNFLKEAEQSKYSVIETPSFQKNAVIPGIGSNAAVNRFAFTNKVGAVSEALLLQSGHGVFMVSEVKEAGIRPFDEVKLQIETRLKREKKVEKVKLLTADMRQNLTAQDGLQKLSAQRPDLHLQHVAPTVLNGFIPDIGRDLGLIGGITGLTANEISKPIEGQRGVYLIKVLTKTPFDSTMYKSQKETLRNQLFTEKRNRVFSDWSEELKKSADIVDNRDLFYR